MTIEISRTVDHSDTCTCREHALPASMIVRAGLDAYLAENGFSVAAYDDKWTKASLFGIPIQVPNTERHRWAIRLHDLHHVATGFGTDLRGEAEISAWEARRGLGSVGLYVASIVASLATFGLLIAPRRTLRAWQASCGGRSLFAGDRDYEALLHMTVGELRDALGVPRQGLAIGPRALHPDAPQSKVSGRSSGTPAHCS